MKKRDIILISVILAVALIFLLVIKLTEKEGAVVVVSINGEEVAEYSLSKNKEYSLNGGTNILKIQDGEAWMIYGDCPATGATKCTNQGKISKTNENITCNHYGIVVSVIGGEAPEVDLIS